MTEYRPILFFAEEQPVYRAATRLEEQAAAQLIELARTVATNDEHIENHTLKPIFTEDWEPFIQVRQASHYGAAKWDVLVGTKLTGGYLVELHFSGRHREDVTLRAVADPEALPEILEGA